MGVFKRAKDIKVAVVGYGGAFNMGKWHLQEMQKAGMTPSAVVDPDATRLDAAKVDFPGVQTYASATEMLERSDANLAVVITPHNTHTPLVLECLRAGRHVVVEKPMAITTAECDTMIREAKKRDLLLSTYHNRHWDGCILHALKQIRKGAIGDVVRVAVHMGQRQLPGAWWRSSKSISGGLLYDWGVHLLEYSLQIVDSEIVEVAGFLTSGYWAQKCEWKDDTIEDEGTIVVRFASGAWLTLNMTNLDPTPDRKWFEVVGTEGAYAWDFENWRQLKKKKEELVATTGKNPESEGWRFYQNVANHLAKGEPLVITPEWARRPIHIIDLACQSAAQGKALKAKHQ